MTEASISFVHLAAPDLFTPPFQEDYALFLLVDAKSVTEDQKNTMSSAIVQSNCDWFLVQGFEGSEWDLAVDLAAIDYDRDVTTTCHDHESLEDALFFLDSCLSNNRKCIMTLGGDGNLLNRCKNLWQSKPWTKE